MKTSLFILALSICSSSNAQRCFDLGTSSLSDMVKIPSSAKQSFDESSKRKIDEHGTLEIADYGDNYKAIDSFMTQKERAFSVETANNMQTPQVSSQSIEDAKQLATKMSTMTEEQKKAYVMQIAQQQMNNKSTTTSMQDGAAIIQLVIQTSDLSARQLYTLVNEYNVKFRAIDDAANAALGKIKDVDIKKCPGVDKTGLPSCGCTNDLYESYWKQKVAVIDDFNQQKINLYQAYLPKVKSLCVQIDQNILKLKMGDAIKSHDNKQKLLSTQAQAFALACSVIASCEESVRKQGADLYINQDNATRKVYFKGCAN